MTTFKLFKLAFLFTMAAAPLCAEELYKWQEADGSLTFSPTPPPASSGISYEKVENLKPILSDPNVEPDIQSAAGDSTDSPAAAMPEQSTSVAPLIQPAGTAPAVADTQTIENPEEPVVAQALAEPQQSPVTLTPPKQKSEHCNELRKRVMSLEQLLTTEISASTMDNAVVQMAMYQDSFNQTCQGLAQR